jgi:hypothetical protein
MTNISIDKLLSLEYNGESYNCAHFTSEAYELLTGKGIDNNLKGLLFPLKDASVLIDMKSKWKRLNSPISPCIAVFTGKQKDPHVGVYYNHKILHITELGVQYVEPSLVLCKFNNMRFYAPQEISNSTQ